MKDSLRIFSSFSDSGNILIICWKLEQKKLSVKKNENNKARELWFNNRIVVQFFAISKINITQSLNHVVLLDFLKYLL